MSYQPFTKKHIAYTAQSDIQIMCQPIFKALDLNYFHYVKFYNDGSVFALYNQTGWHDYFWEQGFQTRAPIPKSPLLLGKASICLWQDSVQDHIVHDASALFDLNDLLSIAIPQDDHFECFAFGASHKSQGVVNNYFNNLDLLLRFTHEFRDRAATLIQQGEKTKVIIPSQQQAPEINLLSSLAKVPICINGNYGEVKISKKELQIAQYVYMGLSATEISDKLCRSSRTVEDHIARLKTKLGCNKRSQLIATLASSHSLLSYVI